MNQPSLPGLATTTAPTRLDREPPSSNAPSAESSRQAPYKTMTSLAGGVGIHPPPARDKILHTPGPLTTSATVKQAMLHDMGSRDEEFLKIVAEVRDGLLEVAGVGRDTHTVVLMQGAGTFALESVITSTTALGDKVVIAVNGAYGRRLVDIARTQGLRVVALEFEETEAVDPNQVMLELNHHPDAVLFGIVHCETSTGLLNPFEPIAQALKNRPTRFLLDSMSGFGALAVDLNATGIDFLVTSPNKCLEGVPGFGVVVARREAIESCKAHARSLSLDLHAQWRGLETDGQFRFTPPTHAILALRQALVELQLEGGVAGRLRRYLLNHRVLVEGMAALGFHPILNPSIQAPIITAFPEPAHPAFDFAQFAAMLSRRGHVIYPGKLTQRACFRIGNIGRLFPADLRALVYAIEEVLTTLGVPVPIPAAVDPS
ncbi:2-aminoethylphosphonate/pyruvate transaminase [Isosphaera pallida ATCC 43644]|uniref:2-aminoethylphosphonate--pyruvate transaminase n=1 Tax=Isosphaera pallida (strain ATCC 43644 / DSM 9630 / IS1B) TaxID=575540 RepID=E8R317_ISOPI|nr:2-aminoethylphosphonate--pyruvate transaminase [Isosphaera pallida]ADV61521.1 2-aminoethylphosphonate/pyruvate transaminase [Isosphaera pallida ATCC 43644]